MLSIISVEYTDPSRMYLHEVYIFTSSFH